MDIERTRTRNCSPSCGIRVLTIYSYPIQFSSYNLFNNSSLSFSYPGLPRRANIFFFIALHAWLVERIDTQNITADAARILKEIE